MPLPAPLAPLAAHRQFIAVLLSPKANKPGKTDKFPIDPYTYKVADAHDPRIWLDYDSAERTAAAFGQQGCVGFVLTERDPFWCLDIDSCATPQGWSGLAQTLCSYLPGTAIEVSQSGQGLHVWGSGPVPPHGKKNVKLGIELYTELRFIALGRSATGAIQPNAPGIAAVATAYFPPIEASAVLAVEGPSPEWRGPTDDADLIRRALNSRGTKAAFGQGASFADLWDANVEVLSRAYPSQNDGDLYDASSADAALAQHLAFWTGRDVARIERLMRQSKLVRPKWEDRTDYLVERTIIGACGRQREVLQDKPVEAGPMAQAVTPAMAQATPAFQSSTPQQRAVEGSTFLTPQGQMELFKGCVYIIEQHRVLVPGGRLLKDSNFRSTYGGYTFAMDAANEKVSRNAWEAFTESQVLRPPRADGTCFRPDLPPGAIVQEAGRTRANLWWPVDVPSVEGDVKPFTDHLAKLLPDERDRTILLSYFAACVQYPGKKFDWAPVIQGVEGNGKTTLSHCVAEALGRRYTHWPKAKKLTKDFNAWLFGKLLYCVEDVHTVDSQQDILEELKPMITGGNGYEIEGKGVDQVSTEICGNFIFNTNHKNGLRKSRNDRRLCILYCAQQDVDDLARDGLDEAYMDRLYAWLNAGGYANVTHYLRSFAIPDEFNPATKCRRAPRTSSTEAAIEQGLGRIEQEVMEAVEQGKQGFLGGWISSMAFDHLLERMGRAGAIPLARRRDVLKSLGYDWHPGLPLGRVHNTILPDGGKPKLFIKHGHPTTLMTDAGMIAKAYTKAQEGK